MKDIAIYGAGGFGRELACLLRRINEETSEDWNLIGFFDDGVAPGDGNEYGRVLGGMETLNDWPTPLAVAFAIGNPKIVKLLYSKITNDNISFPNIIAPDTLFLDKNNVRMGKGNVICSRSLISCNVEIGDFNTLNGYITVGHDTKIGNFNTFMPAVKISGGVVMEDGNFCGVNSVILQYKTLSSEIIVGAGSVVMRNIKRPGTYIGNPAKKIEY